MRGAAVSRGGKAIIAMPSRTSKGAPRIVTYIREVRPDQPKRKSVQQYMRGVMRFSFFHIGTNLFIIMFTTLPTPLVC